MSVLHLSDLHRSAEDPISNDELIAALVTDRVRYTKGDSAITAPNAVVVSGDVIQGVGLGHPMARAELDRQYKVAEEFLARVADEFLQGDRSRLVIGPGNHDVDWNLARQSMESVVDEAKVRPMDALRIEGDLRWSWSERRVYKIVDREMYGRRFDAYWDFVERFYSGAGGIPKVSRDQPYSLFQLAGGRVGIAVFNSCYQNDCFAFHGAIQPSAIAAAHNCMRRDHSFQLWMAVWHHSVHGVPYRNDYMDIGQVQEMVGLGFRLGLHGHQHRHQVLPTSVHLPDEETMAVVSAGSLCAGPKELPVGFYRQYNIVEIQDDLRKARVHVRQMETAKLFSPCHLTLAGGRSYVDISWSPALPFTSPSRHVDSTTLEAERVFRAGDASKASSMLGDILSMATDYGRSLYIEAASKAERWEDIAGRLTDPRSVAELTALVEAFDRMRNTDAGLKALNSHAERVGMPQAQRKLLEQRLKARGGTTK